MWEEAGEPGYCEPKQRSKATLIRTICNWGWLTGSELQSIIIMAGVLLNAFSRPARKNTTDQNLLRQNFIAYIFRSQSARSKRERKRNPVPILGELYFA